MQGLTELEADVLWRIACRSQTYLELLHHYRWSRPRMWSGAVGGAICRLHRAGWVELDGVKWSVRRRPVLKLGRSHAAAS